MPLRCALLHVQGNYCVLGIGDKEMHGKEMMFIRKSIDLLLTPAVGGWGNCLQI
jgi:hypothetical protein